MQQTPNPDPTNQPAWTGGTQLRDDLTGIYSWPPPALADDPDSVKAYPSVTTILDEFTGSGMKFAEAWFQAEYTHELAKAVKARELVPVWVDSDNVDGGESIMIEPLDILLNQCHEGFGKSFGLHWLKKAGGREMRRRANRGTVLHTILEEWASGVRIDAKEVREYVGALIQGHGFTIPVDSCEYHAVQLIRWLNKHVTEVHMSEAMVMSETYNFAGTLDIMLEVRNHPEIEGVGVMDVKGSKADQPSHELQIAAYAFAEYVGIRGTADRLAMPPAHWGANLYVTEDSARLRYWPRIRPHEVESPLECEPFAAFLYARMLWQVMYSDQHPKTVKPLVPPIKPAQLGIPRKLADILAQRKLDI